MEALYFRLAMVALAVGSLGASYRTPNFVVSAPSESFAQQVGEEAERFRKELAVEWLGHELPRWRSPCPISVKVGDHLGAGGATSFSFHRGEVTGWRMSIQGSAKRVLDSVLPHEVNHTIFATHFRRPLPRWADEGACTVVEHPEEKAKQKKYLIRFLKTRRGIAFSRMFAMSEYPRDVMPLYSQGYSVTRYLIAQGGKKKFVKYIGAGMQSGNWTRTTRKFYGFENLGELQDTWLDWVREGSALPLAGFDSNGLPAAQLAANTTEEQQSSAPSTQLAGPLVPLNGEKSENIAAQAEQVASSQTPRRESAPSSDGWVAVGGTYGRLASKSSEPSPAKQEPEVLMEWSQPTNAAPQGQTPTREKERDFASSQDVFTESSVYRR